MTSTTQRIAAAIAGSLTAVVTVPPVDSMPAVASVGTPARA